MPILRVEMVGVSGRADLAQELANAAGQILDSEPGGTWIKLHYLPEAQYAENGGKDPSIKPVLVSVLMGRCSEGSELRRIAETLADKFSTVLSRPKENIHILFEPSAVGRIAFGGRLVEK